MKAALLVTGNYDQFREVFGATAVTHVDITGKNQPVELGCGLIPAADGSLQPADVDATWITPTGGGYFFAPSINTMERIRS